MQTQLSSSRPATLFVLLTCGFVAGLARPAARAQDIDSMPAVVIRTAPEAGSVGVPPGVTEIRVTFSKEMAEGSWSWSSAWQGSEPEMIGGPKFEPDRRTCVVRARLEPGRAYGYWLNSERFKNFKDTRGVPSVPYLLVFQAARADAGASGENLPKDRVSLAAFDDRLNDDQRRVLAWTDRQFRSFFDARNFERWNDAERAALETKSIGALNGPVNREYYQAIGTLAALRSTNALPKLRELAFERREKNNRDRWMAVRALGLMGDKASVPDLIHLVYHGNVNTRWWAQISLVRLTGENFGSDWKAWGRWWNGSGGTPSYRPETVQWWNGQAPPDRLAASLEENDRKFLSGLPPAGDLQKP